MIKKENYPNEQLFVYLKYYPPFHAFGKGMKPKNVQIVHL